MGLRRASDVSGLPILVRSSVLRSCFAGVGHEAVSRSFAGHKAIRRAAF